MVHFLTLLPSLTQALSDGSKLSSNPIALFDKSGSAELVMVADFEPLASSFQEGDAVVSM